MSKDRAITHSFEGEQLESVFVGRRDGQARPTVILIPGIGMIAWGKDKSESRVTAEFYNCAVEVMRGAEAIGDYIALDEQEARVLGRIPEPRRESAVEGLQLLVEAVRAEAAGSAERSTR